MNYSALTDPQQQCQQYQQYQQQEQQPPDFESQPYDTTQPQTQTQTRAYEAYYYHHYDPSSYHPQYYPQSYPHACPSSSYQPPPPGAEPTPTPSASAAAPPGSGQIYVEGHVASQDQPAAAYDVPLGLNPAAAAAVAALSQLTQFAGTMEAAERAMAGIPERQWHEKGGRMTPPPPYHLYHPQHHQMHAPIRPGIGGRNIFQGGSRRGGRPFRGRGGGRGNFGHQPQRQNVGGPPIVRGRARGRGKSGRGGGRQFLHSTHGKAASNTTPASVAEESLLAEAEQEPGQTSSQVPAAVNVSAPVLRHCPLLPIAWCDICRVDCNSLEILEQHKNGKRHKRTVQRMQEIQAQQKLVAELQTKVETELIPSNTGGNKLSELDETKKMYAALDEMPPVVLSNQDSEENKSFASSGSMTPAIFSFQISDTTKGSAALERTKDLSFVAEKSTKSEMQNQTAGGQSEPVELEAGTKAPISHAPKVEAALSEHQAMRSRMDVCSRHDMSHDQKRKMMRYGRGGKRMRSFEPCRGRHPLRPREQPRVCTLCNVMCDTLAVFECHLSGKKHISRIKRFQSQGSIYGPITVYIPPNQPTAYPLNAPEPLFYGLKSHEMLQREAYVPGGVQLEHHVLQQGDQTVNAEESAGVALESQTEQGPEHLKDLPTAGSEEVVTTDTAGQDDPRPEEEHVQSTKASAPEISSTDGDADFTSAEDTLPPPEYGTLHSDNFVLPGLEVKVENTSNIEEASSGG
ncbi:uncharacterized protein [Typha latifolia]|uniref:uncharacterized protein n=1 Tax=Typha latifolia TaxID=4733 RepID=UPI003C2BE50A